MKTIQKITEKESEKVQYLIEKRNALLNLKMLLEKDDTHKDLYTRCVVESEALEKEYQKWWEDIFLKYHLEDVCQESLVVDAVSGELQLI